MDIPRIQELPTVLPKVHAAPVKTEYYSRKVAMAVRCGAFREASYYISLGGLCSYQDRTGQTALHYTAWQGSEGMAELLLRQGAIVDERDNSGETPLHIAARYGRRNLILLFLEYGAKRELRNHLEQTAEDIAIKSYKGSLFPNP